MSEKRKSISVLIGGVHTFLPQELIRGIESECRKQDVNVLFFLGAQTEGFYEAALNIKGDQSYDYQFNTIYDYSLVSGADGIILNYGTVGMYLKEESNVLKFTRKFDDKPLILMTDHAEGDRYPSIISDNYQGFYDVVSHLIEEHHCKKVVHISGPNNNLDASERRMGYLDACRDHGIEVTPEMIVVGDFSEFVTAEVEQILDQNPDADAIAFANDEMSFSGYQVCEERGLTVGKDILITGYDDCTMAKDMNPPLTTVLQDGQKMGRIAVGALLKLCQGDQVENYRVPVKTIIRQSCGCEVADREGIAPKTELDLKRELKEAHHMISEMKRTSIDEERKSWFIPYFVRELDEKAGNDRDFCYKVVEGMKLSKAKGAYLFLFDTPHVCYSESNWELPDDLRLAAWYKDDECFSYERFDRPLVGKETMLDFMNDGKRHSQLIFLLFSGCVQYGILACDIDYEDFSFYYMLSLQLGISLGYHEGRKVELAYRNQLMSDMEEIREEKQKLVIVSEYDSLTGVLNRRGFFQHAEKLFENCSEKLCLVFADLDHLKQVNDTYGHVEGDFAIKSCADILRSISKEGSLVARLGGDEFVCLVANGEENFENYFSTNKEDALRKFNEESGKPYYVEFSYGIYRGEINNISDLQAAIGKADHCLYQSKMKRRKSVLR